MAQQGSVELVATDPLTQFRAAIAQNAAAYLDLTLPQGISAGRTCRSRLKGISIQSVENIGWEIWLFTKKRTGAEAIVPAAAAGSAFQGYWTFTASMALRIAGAGLYYYYVDGLDVPYEATDVLADGQPDDETQRKNLHIALVAREAGKSADDAGAVRVQFVLEGTLGF